MNALNFCLALALCPFQAAGSWPEVTLAPEGSLVDLGRHCLLSGCVFFPSGALPRGQERICLRSPAGARYPTQAWSTSVHPDRSVRSMRLVAEIPGRLARSPARLEVVKGASPAPSKRLVVTEASGGVTVDTGAMKFGLARSGPGIFSSLQVGGGCLNSLSRPARITLAAGSGLYSSEFEDSRAVGVRQQGAIQSLLSVSGLLIGPDENAAAGYLLRLTFQAGSSVAELEWTVTALGDLGLVEDLCFELPLDLGGTPAAKILGSGSRLALKKSAVRVAALDGRRLLGLAGDERIALDPSSRAGLLLSGSGPAEVAAVVSRMRPNAPRMLEAIPPGTIRLSLYEGPFFLEAGQAFRCDFALAAFPRSARPRVLSHLTREPLPSLRCILSPETAVPSYSPLPGAAEGRLAGAAPQLLRVVEEGLLSEVGMVDYGDYRYLEGWANLEYDPAAAFFLRYLENGDGQSLILARDQLHHLVTQDCSNGEKGVPIGFPWQHGKEHRSWEFEAGHVWAAGLVLGSMILGEPEWFTAAEDLRRALAEICGGGASFSAERSYGWSILALEDLQLLAPNPELDRISRRLVRDLIQTQDQRGYFRIDPAREQTGAVFAPAPWVTAGITMEALYRHHLRTGDRQAKASLDLAAEFVIRDARNEDGTFAKRVYFGDELVNGMGRSGQASAVDLMLIAAGLGRATLLGSQPGVDTLFHETLLIATRRICSTRLNTNQACRALQAVRSLANTNQILGTD